MSDNRFSEVASNLFDALSSQGYFDFKATGAVTTNGYFDTFTLVKEGNSAIYTLYQYLYM